MMQATAKRRRMVLLCVMVLATYAIYRAGGFGPPRPGYRAELPEFELGSVLTSGRPVTAASFTQRPALINVWASWCLACRTEHELLLALSESGRIAIYGVNYLDDQDDAIRWLNYYGNPYALSVYDHDGTLGSALGVDVVPRTFLLGTDGRIHFAHVGPLDAAMLDEEIWPRVAAMEAGKK